MGMRFLPFFFCFFINGIVVIFITFFPNIFQGFARKSQSPHNFLHENGRAPPNPTPYSRSLSLQALYSSSSSVLSIRSGRSFSDRDISSTASFIHRITTSQLSRTRAQLSESTRHDRVYSNGLFSRSLPPVFLPLLHLQAVFEGANDLVEFANPT